MERFVDDPDAPSAQSLARRGSFIDRIPARCEVKLNSLSKPTDVDDVLFDLLCDKQKRVFVAKFWTAMRTTGLRQNDPRLRECKQRFEKVQKEAGSSGEGWDFTVDRDTFKECVSDNIFLIGKAFKNDLVIPDFRTFTRHIELVYIKCKHNNKGKPADYIPQLARVDPNYWGVSICTIDGQRHNFGDTGVPFCLQSTCKPLNYALALSDMGERKVHHFVGQEPSGRSFNELTLDTSRKPHNPLINSGAIVTTSLLKPNLQMADRFDYVFNQYKRLAGGQYIGFSNSTYLSERETADRNFALGYYMRENQCFPPNADLIQTLEFYFQLCSVEATAESGAVIAATLANGGICPTSGERILAGDAIRNTLSLMYSCGMYDYSGQFAFKVGLPAKSGVAGAILLVVPNVMGICCWSPPLDSLGNSCRGVQFCEELVKHFNFHNYDDLNHSEKKLDPRKRKIDNGASSVVNLLFGAANGDVTAIRRFALSGMDMTAGDYDGRTALHLAAAEGHLSVAKMLVEQCKVPLSPQDRWGFTPLDDALKFDNTDVAEYLRGKSATTGDYEEATEEDAEPSIHTDAIRLFMARLSGHHVEGHISEDDLSETDETKENIEEQVGETNDGEIKEGNVVIKRQSVDGDKCKNGAAEEKVMVKTAVRKTRKVSFKEEGNSGEAKNQTNNSERQSGTRKEEDGKPTTKEAEDAGNKKEKADVTDKKVGNKEIDAENKERYADNKESDPDESGANNKSDPDNQRNDTDNKKNDPDNQRNDTDNTKSDPDNQESSADKKEMDVGACSNLTYESKPMQENDQSKEVKKKNDSTNNQNGTGSKRNDSSKRKTNEDQRRSDNANNTVKIASQKSPAASPGGAGFSRKCVSPEKSNKKN